MEHFIHVIRALGMRDIQLLAMLGFIATTVTLFTATCSAWVGGYFGARRVAARLREEQQQHIARSDEELAHLRQTLEAVAIEVERISEGQRFTARLLAERAESRHVEPPRRRPGATTPH